MKYARKYLMSLQLDEIPQRQRWVKSYGKEAEHELTHGINLKRFGFLNEAIPNARRNEITGLVHPVGLDQELFWGEENKEFNVKIRKRTGWWQISRRHLIPSQAWVDRERILELLAKPCLDPVRLTQVGQYMWVVDGMHRIVARWLRGGLIRCDVAELGRIK